MLNNNIICLLINLVSIYSLINSPTKWFTNQILQLRNSANHVVFGVVCVDYGDVVLLGQGFEVVEELFYHGAVVVVFGGDAREKGGEGVDHYHADVEGKFFLFKHGDYFGEEDDKLVEFEDLEDSEAGHDFCYTF